MSVVTLMQPAPVARWLVLDIETEDAPESAIQSAIEAWKAPSNWKPETVEKNRAEAAEKIRSKAALLDASPILCVGIRTDAGGTLFTARSGIEVPPVDGWMILQFDGERMMLAAMASWLNANADDASILAGHNVRDFDLPKLRGAYVRNRLPIPACLRPRMEGPGQPIADTMKLFRSFSMEHRDSLFVSLDTVAAAFQIPRPKAVISGAEVPELARAGRFAEIWIYCCVDVDTTAEIYRLMMS